MLRFKEIVLLMSMRTPAFRIEGACKMGPDLRVYVAVSSLSTKVVKVESNVEIR